jgi:hypothetical protein
MNRLSSILVAGLSLAVVLLGATIAEACPSCQQALANDGSQGDLARGIYYSILFMMSMPFAIVGAFAGLAYRAVKREQRRQADEAAAKTPDSPQVD